MYIINIYFNVFICRVRMSLLPVTVILSMIVLVYAGQWDLPESKYLCRNER